MKALLDPLKPASLYLFISLMAGICAGNYFTLLKNFSITALILCSAAFFTVWLINKRLNRKILLSFCCVLFFLTGFAFIQAKSYPEYSDNHITHFTDQQKYLITGKISSFAKHYNRKTKYVLKDIHLDQNGTALEVKGKINFTVYGTTPGILQFGDNIQFKSKIKSIRNFENPGGFDYKKFLKFQSIFGSAWATGKKITIISSPVDIDVSAQILRKIESFRTRYSDFVLHSSDRSVGANILLSLVAGKKEGLLPGIRDTFSRAGISHLLAISGLHLSIVSFMFFYLIYRSLSFFENSLISGRSKKLAGIISLLPLAAYAIFTGFSPSTQRALIMIGIVLVSFVIEKEKDIISSLSVAGIVILLIDAASLFSISFQLSFFAVGFIVLGLSHLKKYPGIFKKTFFARTGMMMAVTFFASMGTAPLTSYYFNMLSFIGLASNLIFIPLIGFIVLPLGLVSLACFSFFPLLSKGIVQICVQLIDLTVFLCEIITRIPFSWFRVVTPEKIEIILLYAILLCLFLVLKKKKKAFFVLVCLIFISGCTHYWTKKNKLQSDLLVTILDVGQGSSALIQTPDQTSILVDGGGFSGWSSFDTGRFIVAPFLWKKGITYLDYVILTHPEGDHLNGLVYIFDNFKIGKLIKNYDESNTLKFNQLIATCKDKDVEILYPSKDKNCLGSCDVALCFIDTTDKSYSKDLNNNSLVFKLVYNNFSMLFTGDILSEREEQLSQMSHMDLDVDVLLSPHHGSSTSSTKVFLDKVRPRSVIISCGWNNRYGFPHSRVLKRYNDIGALIYRTDQNGAVFISSNGKVHNILTSKGG